MEHEKFKKYLNKLNKSTMTSSPLSSEKILMNALLTSKRLIIEIEDLERLISSINISTHQNEIIILSAELESIKNKIKEIRRDYFYKQSR